ncbi:CBL-interacting protein kinase 23 [Porphyridium purpureum]|uniref:non-specific serine/threonine protein kinase n=1 Tax=Porphyridium purpureum TaxID=35688 RepID=A0A5J4Z2H4_PORPP|nr:CBL-interacting protein kinase 23 [Porphyridium purpureum]|eukprot:POR9490..scf208_2
MTTRIGPYLLLRTLGTGNFGKVKLAVHNDTGVQYAVKIMDKAWMLKHGMSLQVKREIAIMKALSHPNVVSLYEVLASQTKLYLVMELVSGGELFDVIAQQAEYGGLKEDVARRYFHDLIDAVHYCHRRGVFHRDLKPENLLLNEKGELKVTDFGLSGISGVLTGQELLTTMCGTPSYIAPEIVRERGGYEGSKVDAWACGIILYAMLTGCLPFDGEDPAELFLHIQTAPVEFPPGVKVEPLAKALICGLLEKDPKSRLSLESVKQHPWFLENYMGDDAPHKPKLDVKTISLFRLEGLFSAPEDAAAQKKPRPKSENDAAARKRAEEAANITAKERVRRESSQNLAATMRASRRPTAGQGQILPPSQQPAAQGAIFTPFHTHENPQPDRPRMEAQRPPADRPRPPRPGAPAPRARKPPSLASSSIFKTGSDLSATDSGAEDENFDIPSMKEVISRQVLLSQSQRAAFKSFAVEAQPSESPASDQSPAPLRGSGHDSGFGSDGSGPYPRQLQEPPPAPERLQPSRPSARFDDASDDEDSDFEETAGGLDLEESKIVAALRDLQAAYVLARHRRQTESLSLTEAFVEVFTLAEFRAVSKAHPDWLQATVLYFKSTLDATEKREDEFLQLLLELMLTGSYSCSLKGVDFDLEIRMLMRFVTDLDRKMTERGGQGVERLSDPAPSLAGNAELSLASMRPASSPASAASAKPSTKPVQTAIHFDRKQKVDYTQLAKVSEGGAKLPRTKQKPEDSVALREAELELKTASLTSMSSLDTNSSSGKSRVASRAKQSMYGIVSVGGNRGALMTILSALELDDCLKKFENALMTLAPSVHDVCVQAKGLTVRLIIKVRQSEVGISVSFKKLKVNPKSTAPIVPRTELQMFKDKTSASGRGYFDNQDYLDAANKLRTAFAEQDAHAVLPH